MPPIFYKVHSTLSRVGDGATRPNYIAVVGVAKGASAGSPYVVANEIVCGALGRGLGLPIPPGFLVKENGEAYHVSLNFNLTADSLPPADPAALVAALPELAAGIVLFDAWVLNDDRHNKNLAFDTSTTQAVLFDHSHAFLGSGNNGRARLASLVGQPSLGGHCLKQHLTSAAAFPWWQARIMAIPEFWIRMAVEEASHVGLQREDVEYCVNYLLERRGRLIGLLRGNRALFPNIEPDLWDSI